MTTANSHDRPATSGADGVNNERLDGGAYAIVVFGPPGSGKTTLCRAFSGLDLSDLPRAARRPMIQELHRQPDRHLVIGAAETQPEEWSSALFIRVLLYPEKSVWDQRRRQRDAREGRPDEPLAHDWYDGFGQGIERYERLAANAQLVLATAGGGGVAAAREWLRTQTVPIAKGGAK